MISRCKHEPAGRGWRRDLMAVSVIALAGAGCAPEAPPAISSFEDTVAVQARLNEYFHAQVLPRLQPCWQRLEGSGRVAIAHSYVRDRGAPGSSGSIAC